jgi:hypothetical protein
MILMLIKAIAILLVCGILVFIGFLGEVCDDLKKEKKSWNF